MRTIAFVASLLILVALVLAGLVDHPRSPSVLVLGAVCVIAGFVALSRTSVAIGILGLGCVIAAMGSGTLVVAVVSGWILLAGVGTSWMAGSGPGLVSDLSTTFLVGVASLAALAMSFLIGVALRPGPEVAAADVVVVALALAGVFISSQQKGRTGWLYGILSRMGRRS